jgi:hypothetical protein
MLKALMGLTLFAAVCVAAGCAHQQTTPGKPAKPVGTPPPSASNVPPPPQPGKSPDLSR